MGKFAVIDTETNWADQGMSIGTVIADADTFAPVEMKYHILPIECQIGGMYYDALFPGMPVKPILCIFCRDHKRSGFIHGVQVGIRLAEELK